MTEPWVLPAGWRWEEFGGLVSSSGKQVHPDKLDESTAYVGLEHIEPHTGQLHPSTVGSQQPKSSKRVFDKDVVLYGRLRPYLNKAAVPIGSGVCSTDILVLSPQEPLYLPYLAWYMRSPFFWRRATSLVKGARLPRVSFDQLRDFPIPVPPVEIQEEIAEVLDRAQSAKRATEDLQQILSEIPLSRLYKSMPKTLGAPVREGWRWEQLGSLLTSIRNGGDLPKTADGYPLTRLESIRKGIINPKKVDHCQPSENDLSKFGLINEDILLTRVNSLEQIGVCAIYTDSDGPLLADYNLMLLRVDKDQVDPWYLIAYLATQHVRELLRTRSRKAVNQVSLNRTDVRELPVLIPPATEQDLVADLARRTYELSRTTRALQDSLGRAIWGVAHKCFRGELSYDQAS